MSIIYSYPTVQPAADDLLIGTDVGSDNITKSFTISSIASLVGEIASAGTVNSVQIATDAFLSAVGGPITTSGTITIGLTALGTPSANTFLRGDNRWVTPTVSAGIYAFNQNTQITDDISSINFRGNGVVASSAPDGSVTVQIDGDSGGVNSITNGTGISVNQSTGDVEITNTGVTRLTAGSNITLSAQTGNVTISSSGGTGGVSIVSAGRGLTLQAGNSQSNPTIAVDYDGTNNFIRLGENPEVATASDFMLFEDVITGNVKSTTLGTIPTSALSLVETSINTVDSNAVKHNTDIYPSIPTVFQVITLTQAEYNDIATKNGNTLYLIGGGVTQITKILAITNNIIGTEYTIGGDQAGLPKTGAQGSAYNFTTTVTANPGFEFSEPLVIQNAQGIYDTNGTVYTILSGTVSAIVPSNCTTTLDIVNNLTIENGAVLGDDYEFTSTRTSLTAPCNTEYSSFENQFGVAVELTASANTNQWEIINPVYTYSPASGTLNGTPEVQCIVTGTVREKSYNLTYTITDNNSGGVYGTDYTIVNSNPSGVSFSGGTAPLAQTISGRFSDPYNIVTTYSNVGSSSNNTIINSALLGTVNGNVVSGITGTLGEAAPVNVFLSQNISSTTSPVAAAPSFQFSIFVKNIECVQTSATPTDCSTNPVGYTYAGMTYTVTPPSTGVESAPIPINLGTTVTQYNNLDFENNTVIRLYLADPTLDPGFYALNDLITTQYSGTGVNLNGQFTLTSGQPTKQVGVVQGGRITNRVTAGNLSPGQQTDAGICDISIGETGLWLQKGPGNTLDYAQNNDYAWADPIQFLRIPEAYYHAAVGVNVDNLGSFNVSAAGLINSVQVCPDPGFFNIVVNDAIEGPSQGYSISTTYQVNGGDPLPAVGGNIEANDGDVITTTTVVNVVQGYWSPYENIAVTYVNNPVTIVAGGSSTITSNISGDIAQLNSILLSVVHDNSSSACDDTNSFAQSAYSTYSPPVVGTVFESDGTTRMPAGFYNFNNGQLVIEIGNFGIISTAVACPAEGTAILSVDDQVDGNSSWYTISSTYTVTPPGGSPGSSIPYTNTPVTAIAGSTVTFVTTVVANSGFYWSSGPIVTPAGNNSVTITADSQVQANVTVQGTAAALTQVRTTETLSDGAAACGDDADQQDAWKTGGSILPSADEILYGDNTGTNFADPGFYRILGTTKSFEVDSNGVISNVTNCNTVSAFNDGEQPNPTLNYDITASHTINGGTSIPGAIAQGNVGDTVVFTIVASVRDGYYETSPFVVTYPSSQTIIIPPPGSSSNTVNFEVTGGTAPLQQIFTSTKSNDLGTVCDLPATTTSSWKTGSSVVAVGDILYTQSNVNSSFRETGYYKEVNGSGDVVVLSIDGNTGEIVQINDNVCNLIAVQTTATEIDRPSACSALPDQQYAWKTGVNSTPQNGQTLYSNFAGTDFADPGYYVIFGTNRSFEVVANGIISNVQDCT